jgi:hypothetical protein
VRLERLRKPLVLKISVANPSSVEGADDVYASIENGLEGAECYRLDRSKVTAAAIEFVVILSSAAAIATIANFLYNVWKDNRDKGHLYVYLNPDVQIMIEGQTSMIEIEEIQRRINNIQASGQLTQMDHEILEEIKQKRIWIRTK